MQCESKYCARTSINHRRRARSSDKGDSRNTKYSTPRSPARQTISSSSSGHSFLYSSSTFTVSVPGCAAFGLDGPAVASEQRSTGDTAVAGGAGGAAAGARAGRDGRAAPSGRLKSAPGRTPVLAGLATGRGAAGCGGGRERALRLAPLISARRLCRSTSGAPGWACAGGWATPPPGRRRVTWFVVLQIGDGGGLGSWGRGRDGPAWDGC